MPRSACQTLFGPQMKDRGQLTSTPLPRITSTEPEPSAWPQQDDCTRLHKRAPGWRVHCFGAGLGSGKGHTFSALTHFPSAAGNLKWLCHFPAQDFPWFPTAYKIKAQILIMEIKVFQKYNLHCAILFTHLPDTYKAKSLLSWSLHFSGRNRWCTVHIDVLGYVLC